MVVLPAPDGAENMIAFPFKLFQVSGFQFLAVNNSFNKPNQGNPFYKTFNICSLIFSSSSFILTTIFCISA